MKRLTFEALNPFINCVMNGVDVFLLLRELVRHQRLFSVIQLWEAWLKAVREGPANVPKVHFELVTNFPLELGLLEVTRHRVKVHARK